ncbi:glycosyltransferase family 2 protein [Pedobacter jamesrossensis]|uniref:Glycosyltransferase family 2 protein n=1 Tax=Pedobacter jamesrossensis TaxID=1908238 RepID=A0ABV8NSF6_9SPHI
MPKQVAVILLNWNTPTHTANCISSLIQFCDHNVFDLIIADNGSTDNSLSILQSKFPKHIYIDNKENLGFAGGNNRALEYSIAHNYNYSILLNNDTEVDEDFITPMLNYLENHQAVVAVQPAIYYLHKKDKLWNGGSFFNNFLGETYSKNQKSRQALRNPEKVDWLTGCCFMVRNNALKQAGLLNEKFFLYYEDVELSYRLKASFGELHYFPATKIYHEAGVSGQQTKNKEGTLSPIIHYYLCRNKIWFLRKYSNPFFALVIFLKNAIYYSALLSYFLLRKRFKKAKYLYLGIKEGLFTPKSSIWP